MNFDMCMANIWHALWRRVPRIYTRAAQSLSPTLMGPHGQALRDQSWCDEKSTLG